MIKEKSKSKNKIKLNKNPLPKIKPNHNNLTVKLKPLNNKAIPDLKNNKDLEHLKVNYPKEQKQILPKTNIRVKEVKSVKNSSINNNNQSKNKLTLKYLLKEYGLMEYHKKFIEIGYNNENFLEIGNISKKNLNSLMNKINLLPFHYEKLEKFYEYVKKLNYNHGNKKTQNPLQQSNPNSTPIFPKRKFNFNFNSVNNNLNKYKLNLNENSKTNQMYNQYQNFYNNYIAQENDNIINNYNSNYNNKDILIYDLSKNNTYQKKYNRKSLNINRSRKKRSFIKAKNRPRPRTSNPKLHSKYGGLNRGNQIFKVKIRNNLSGKKLMKKKLNHFSAINSPYLSNSIDDNSSLIRSYFNDYQSLAENHKMNLFHQNMDIMKINPNQNKFINNKNINNNNNENNFLYKSQNNYELNKIQNKYEYGINDNIERMLNLYMIQLNEKLDKSYESIEDSSLSHIITSQMNENQNPNPKKISNNKLPKINEVETKPIEKKEVKNEIINNNNEKNVEETKKAEVESSKELKRISDHDTSTKSKDSKDQQIEPVEDFEEKKYLTKEEAEKLLSEIDVVNDKKYNIEQNIYETIRLNKSFDEENNNKETIKYDIEFICRCLGLALMKIIEQGQEREHITDLYDKNINNKNKFNFSFLNEEFNDNIFLIEEFFNTENKTNKNIDEKNKILLGDKNIIPILEKFNIQKEGNDTSEINMLKHLKKTGDENNIIKDDSFDKLHNDLLDMDKEIKFLGHYFSYQRPKIKDYQGLCENTKKILGKDLSYIKEIDSEMNGTGSKCGKDSDSNGSKSNKTIKENNSLLNDSKNNQENMNKILDDSGEYEDEFLKEKCIEELKNNNNYEIKSDDLITNSELNQKEPDKEKALEKENEKLKELEKENEKEEEIITSKYNNQESTNNNSNQIGLKKGIQVVQNLQDIESSYIIDVENIKELKIYLLSKFEVFDEDYMYISNSIPAKRLMESPDPQTIFEFCANIMLLTKIEKESIIVALIYIERLIFNTGLLINSRNWRKIIFTALIMASKIWDDDSLENLHFSQIFTHLKIGEINLLERNFMEMINYNLFIKFSEFMKYYFALKDMCLRYNYNGEKVVRINPQKIIRIQEYRYQLQKRMNKTLSLNNSASF